VVGTDEGLSARDARLAREASAPGRWTVLSIEHEDEGRIHTYGHVTRPHPTT
jgi:hypothetical protein